MFESYLNIGMFLSMPFILFNVCIMVMYIFQLGKNYVYDRKEFELSGLLKYVYDLKIGDTHVYGWSADYFPNFIVFPFIVTALAISVMVLCWPIIITIGVVWGILYLLRFMVRCGKYFNNINKVAHTHKETEFDKVDIFKK
jgi:hypothetical protein